MNSRKKRLYVACSSKRIVYAVCLQLLLGPHLLHWPEGASHSHSDLSWKPRSMEWCHTGGKIRNDWREGRTTNEGCCTPVFIVQQDYDEYPSWRHYLVWAVDLSSMLQQKVDDFSMASPCCPYYGVHAVLLGHRQGVSDTYTLHFLNQIWDQM